MLTGYTRGVFYVRRVVDLMKTAKVNASCIYLERLSFYLYMQPKIISKYIYFNDFQEAKTNLYIAHWKDGRNMTFMDFVSDRTLVTLA